MCIRDRLEYANKEPKATFTVVTKYTGRRIAKEDFTLPPYNPFITTTDLDMEVHLTNMRPTEKLDKEKLGIGHDKSDPSANLYYCLLYTSFPFGCRGMDVHGRAIYAISCLLV